MGLHPKDSLIATDTGVSVDVLAPEGLGARVDLTTTPPGRTLQVPGGTQALQRTEWLPIRVGEAVGRVPRPSLHGALVGKALAVDVDDLPDAQRSDFAVLLTLVENPMRLADELTSKDRKRLRQRTEMLDREHAAWSGLDAARADQGCQALAFLIN